MTKMHNPTVFTTSVPAFRAYVPKPAHAPFYARVLAYLECHAAPCSFNTLAVNFARQVGGSIPAKNLRCRLNYLVSTGLVEVRGTHGHCLYRRTTMPMPKVELAPAPAPRACDAAINLPGAGRPKVQAIRSGTPLQAVPPCQRNRMEGTYVPPRAPGLRPGALDFAHVPSRGVSC